jgi:hypothetical protein
MLEAVDTVATTTSALHPEDSLTAPDGTELLILTTVPRAHKVALRAHAPGDPVLKFGASIGVATEAIKRGQLVHTHNLQTVRGRRPRSAA